MPWTWPLIIVVAGIAGWYAARKHLLGIGVPVGSVHVVTIDATKKSGGAGMVTTAPNDSVVVNVFDPPAGYVWHFLSNGPGLPLASQTATSATFSVTPAMIGASIQAVLLQSGITTVAPKAIYTIGIYPPGGTGLV